MNETKEIPEREKKAAYSKGYQAATKRWENVNERLIKQLLRPAVFYSAYPYNILYVIGMSEIEMEKYSPRQIKDIMNRILTGREKKILFYRYSEGLYMGETGQIFDMVHERIRQVEYRALQKLKKYFVENSSESLNCLLHKGFEKGLVKLTPSPNDGETCCQIGDYWFYFLGDEESHNTPDDILMDYSQNDLIDMIQDAIVDLPEEEKKYYKYFLIVNL